MIWTQSSELPLIQLVCQEIVNDIASGNQLRLGSDYAAMAPSLFGSAHLSVNSVRAPFTDLSVMKASASPSLISLTVGVFRSRGPKIDAERTLSGMLCHELVHQKQGARDLSSMVMFTKIQDYWVANQQAKAAPHDWLVGYYGTVYEFEAHAEQIAFEIWMADTVSGQIPRKSVSLGQVNQFEPLKRIRDKLQAATPSSVISDWLSHLEFKVNEALASW